MVYRGKNNSGPASKASSKPLEAVDGKDKKAPLAKVRLNPNIDEILAKTLGKKPNS